MQAQKWEPSFTCPNISNPAENLHLECQSTPLSLILHSEVLQALSLAGIKKWPHSLVPHYLRPEQESHYLAQTKQNKNSKEGARSLLWCTRMCQILARSSFLSNQNAKNFMSTTLPGQQVTGGCDCLYPDARTALPEPFFLVSCQMPALTSPTCLLELFN